MHEPHVLHLRLHQHQLLSGMCGIRPHAVGQWQLRVLLRLLLPHWQVRDLFLLQSWLSKLLLWHCEHDLALQLIRLSVLRLQLDTKLLPSRQSVCGVLHPPLHYLHQSHLMPTMCHWLLSRLFLRLLYLRSPRLLLLPPYQQPPLRHLLQRSRVLYHTLTAMLLRLRRFIDGSGNGGL